MTPKSIFVATAALATLAACGGGGTGSGGATRYATEFANLQAAFAGPSGTAPIYFTPQANLPGGTATYRGVAAFNFGFSDGFEPPAPGGDLNDLLAGMTVSAGDFDAYMGALTMNVNFAGNTLTGSVRNFETLEGRSVSGSLTISGGSLTTAQNTTEIGGAYAATAAGSIAGDARTFDVSGNVLGETGEGLSVYFEGTGETEGGGTGMAAR